MKKCLIALLLCTTTTTGCAGLGIEKMSAEQIRATSGVINCTYVDSILYGRVASAWVHVDPARANINESEKLSVTCGNVTISRDLNVVPPVTGGGPAVTVTPMEITPMTIRPAAR